MPDRGILVGEAMSAADLAGWASALDETVLPAGASEFYAAYLQMQGFIATETAPLEDELSECGTDLFISGSTSATTHLFRRRCEGHGIPVLRMPVGLFGNGPRSSQLIGQ